MFWIGVWLVSLIIGPTRHASLRCYVLCCFPTARRAPPAGTRYAFFSFPTSLAEVADVNFFAMLYKEPATDNSWFQSVSHQQAMATEFERQGVVMSSRWRVSRINVNYELCQTYPGILAVPQKETDEDLFKVRLERVQAAMQLYRAMRTPSDTDLLGWKSSLTVFLSPSASVSEMLLLMITCLLCSGRRV